MGVYNLFSYISTRYPCAVKNIEGQEIPEFDNLYIDMNSVFHKSINAISQFAMEKSDLKSMQKEIFENISSQIEFIFRAVKPLKQLYLAFDGIAPFAKVDNDRLYRFFQAYNSYDTGSESNQSKNTSKQFDSNWFTAGTEFMTEVLEYVRTFVAYKISIDRLWRKCKVIISGVEVPGENKFKILEFVRYNRSKDNYNPNTKHCLFTIDPDFITLCLSTHEPFFSILRDLSSIEEMNKQLTPEKANFQIFHLCLIREYVECEALSTKSHLKFKFDLEKIIDDLVLLLMLVNNNFLPSLPNLNLKDGALPLVFKTYWKVLPLLNGYLNEHGKLKLDRFEKFLCKLSCIEKKLFELNNECTFLDLEEIYTNILRDGDLDIMMSENKKHLTNKRQKDAIMQLQKNYSEKFYKLTFQQSHEDTRFLENAVVEYVKFIQWNLSYYYNGCCSWTWSYPYRCAPLISDLKDFKNASIKFEIGKPLTSLEYLLAVLPPKYDYLLPMHKELTSLKCITLPKADFNFDEQNEDVKEEIELCTEATKKIARVTLEELRIKMESLSTDVSLEKNENNLNANIYSYNYNKLKVEPQIDSSFFNSIENHAEVELLKANEFTLSNEKIVKGLCRRIKLDVNIPRFPTFQHIPHKFYYELKKRNLGIYGPLEHERVVIDLSVEHTCSLQDVARNVLGRYVHIDWPYKNKAHVYSVTDFKRKITLKNKYTLYDKDNILVEPLTSGEISILEELKTDTTETYNLLGISVGEIKFFVTAYPKIGQQYRIIEENSIVRARNKYAFTEKLVPYQILIKETDKEVPMYKSISNVLVPSSTCFTVDKMYYGSMGKIISVNSSQIKLAITVALNLSTEPSFEALLNDNHEQDAENCIVEHEVAKKLNTTSEVIDKIAKNIWVTEKRENTDFEPRKHNIGLRLKFPMKDKTQLPGYTLNKNDSWYYSDLAVKLIEDYKKAFPLLFEKLAANPKNNIYKSVTDIFENTSTSLKIVSKWLRKSCPAVLSTFSSTEDTIHQNVRKLESTVNNFLSNQKKSSEIDAVIFAQELFVPGTISGACPIDELARHDLLDRVICVRDNFTVPLGLKGTIISIHRTSKSLWQNIYEVLFDYPFPGGLKLYGCSDNKVYSLSISDFINISHGERSRNLEKSIKQVKPKPAKPRKENVNRKQNKSFKPSKRFNKFLGVA